MTIPSIIRREHVLSAIEEIRRTGVPRERKATKYELVFGDLRIPAEYVLSIAAKMATGSELPPDEFSGGDEANGYLRDLGFDVRLRRVDWSRAECYLAVWLYDRFDYDREVNKSALYREVSEITGRSVKSVEWKVQNVSACDPRAHKEKPIAPAANAQRLLEDVFREYWADRVSARNRYAEVLQELSFEPQTPEDAPLPPGNLLIEEGALGFQESFRRQRSRKLIEFARDLFRKKDPGGILRCASCGFSTPSGLSREIIHLHHTKPISELGPDGRQLELKDAVACLVPLCPTCHAIAHTARPPLPPEAIRRVRQT